MAFGPYPGGGGPDWEGFTGRIEARFGQQMKRPVWLWPSPTADLPTDAGMGANEGALAYDDTLNLPTYYTGATWAPLAAYNANLANLATCSQGDLIYGSATNTWSKLSKNTSATRYLSNTGTSNNPAWAQVDLTNGVTGDLPFANLAQGSALSVLGVTGNATADVASIAAGTDGNVLRRSGTAVAFGSIDLTNANTATAAWTSYTPTITADAGTFTTVSATGRSLTIGKLVFYEMLITITTAGTASGGLLASLPSTCSAFPFTAAGRERAATGSMVQGEIAASATTIRIVKYDNSGIIASGNAISLSGFYEAA